MARPLWLSLLALTMTTAPLRAADDAATIFDSLYGRRLQQVSQTPTPADDVQLAADLLKATDEVTDQPALLEVICDHAYILGSKDAAGLDTALSAMNLLASHVDARRPDALEKIAALQQRRLAAARPNDKPAIATALTSTLMELAAAQREQGDLPAATKLYQKAAVAIGSYDANLRQNIRAAIDDIARQQKLTDTQRDLEAALKAEPANAAAAAKLTHLLVADRNDPAAAAAPAKAAGDAVLLHRVTLAAADPSGLTPAELLDLGDWYRALSEQADALAKPAMLDRARVCYTAFLDRAATDELAKKKATLAIAEVDAALRPAGGASTDTATPAAPKVIARAAAAMDGVLALLVKAKLRVYVNGVKVHENLSTDTKDGVTAMPRRIPLKLRPGDAVVLRVFSPWNYRDVRCAYVDRQGHALFDSQPGATMIRPQPSFDAPLSNTDAGAAPADPGRPDPGPSRGGTFDQNGQWLEAKLPPEAKWLRVPKTKTTYDFSFKVPGRNP